MKWLEEHVIAVGAPGGVFMGGGEHSDESEDDGTVRRASPLIESKKGHFMIYTHLTHQRFFRKLRLYLKEKEVNAELSDTEW